MNKATFCFWKNERVTHKKKSCNILNAFHKLQVITLQIDCTKHLNIHTLTFVVLISIPLNRTHVDLFLTLFIDLFKKFSIFFTSVLEIKHPNRSVKSRNHYWTYRNKMAASSLWISGILTSMLFGKKSISVSVYTNRSLFCKTIFTYTVPCAYRNVCI
jgi:hypothetical protein